MSACSNCGEEISPKWVVCPVCAHPAAGNDTASDSPDSDLIFHFAEIHCTKCRKEITPDTQICPHCHVPIIRRYCAGCQRLIPDHVNLCPYCHAERSMKKGLGTIAKVAIFIFVPACFVVAYFTFSGTDSVQRVELSEAIAEPETGPPAPSEADSLRNEPAAELLVEPPSPFTASSVNNAELKPPAPAKPEPVTTNIVEIRRKEKPEPKPKPKPKPEPKPKPIQVEPVQVTPAQVAPVLNYASRGARLKQGRQLKEIGSRLIRQKQYGKAVYVLQDSVRAFPPETHDLSYGEALYNLGYSLRMSGKPAEAIPVLKKALAFAFIRKKAVQELQTATAQLKKMHSVQWAKP